jgi:ring-1,2-phenylacetyl-CoA epoxidase subunit PaaC
LLVEQPNGDFAQTMLKHFLFSTYQFFLFTELKKSSDNKLAALAEKSLKEVTYHLRHSSEWMKRLGDGTGESNSRMRNAVDNLWRYTGDLFDADETDATLLHAKTAPDMKLIKVSWENKVKEIFIESNIPYPENVFMITGSRKGMHSEHLGYILAEMQSLARVFPGAKW